MTTANDRPAFGKLLTALRTDAFLSRRDAAAALEITKSYLWRLEHTYPGVGSPSPDLVYRIARLYQVPPDQLFALAGMIPDDLRDRFADDPTFVSLVRASLAHFPYGGA